IRSSGKEFILQHPIAHYGIQHFLTRTVNDMETGSIYWALHAKITFHEFELHCILRTLINDSLMTLSGIKRKATLKHYFWWSEINELQFGRIFFSKIGYYTTCVLKSSVDIRIIIGCYGYLHFFQWRQVVE